MTTELNVVSVVDVLINKHDELIGFLPLELNRVAKWLVDTNACSSVREGYHSLKHLTETLPNTFIVEQEDIYGDFLSFYHREALMMWAAGEVTIVTETPPKNVFDALKRELYTTKPTLSTLADEFNNLLTGPTPWQLAQIRARMPHLSAVEICPSPSYKACVTQKRNCSHKIHFEQLISSHTDPSLGDCSYLDTCYKGRVCKFVHYKIIYPQNSRIKKQSLATSIALAKASPSAQYLNCNLLQLDLKTLGSDWAAMIIDPPWDIHVNGSGAAAPSGPAGGNDQNIQGIVSDTQVLQLDIGSLQTNGVVFLWVTGRVADMGRQCLAQWGYDHVEELIWCKTNQLARTICTGRTGHWLNHTKEHVLVGIKGNPSINRQIDVDVLVSTTRGQSQKPEELYGIIDRMVGADARKIELFGRASNIRPGWLTIGNEIGASKIEDPELKSRLKL